MKRTFAFLIFALTFVFVVVNSGPPGNLDKPLDEVAISAADYNTVATLDIPIHVIAVTPGQDAYQYQVTRQRESAEKSFMSAFIVEDSPKYHTQFQTPGANFLGHRLSLSKYLREGSHKPDRYNLLC